MTKYMVKHLSDGDHYRSTKGALVSVAVKDQNTRIGKEKPKVKLRLKYIRVSIVFVQFDNGKPITYHSVTWMLERVGEKAEKRY